MYAPQLNDPDRAVQSAAILSPSKACEGAGYVDSSHFLLDFYYRACVGRVEFIQATMAMAIGIVWLYSSGLRRPSQTPVVYRVYLAFFYFVPFYILDLLSS